MNLLDFGEIWSRDLNARLTLQPQGLECPPSQQDSTPKGIEDWPEACCYIYRNPRMSVCMT